MQLWGAKQQQREQQRSRLSRSMEQSSGLLNASPSQQQTLSPFTSGCLAFRSESSSFLPWLGLGLLTISSVVSIYRAHGDLSTIAFVVFAYANLLALFACLSALEKLALDGPTEKKKRLTIAIWVSSTTLTVTFTCRVSQLMMHGIMAIAVWIMAIVTVLASFYALFVYQDPQAASALHQETEDIVNVNKARSMELPPVKEIKV